jgi:hypothetical protein
MPLDGPRPSWWRFPAPSVLVLVLLLSFLPWIEIGCESKVDRSSPFGGFGIQGGPADAAVPNFSGKTILATQSGFQIATGGHSDSTSLGDLRKGNAKGVSVSAPVMPGANQDGPPAAPLMFVFFLLALAAVVAGFALPPSRIRLLAVGAGTGAALVVLLIQSLVLGFPAANDVAKSMKEMGAAPGIAGPDVVHLYVHYTVWYWLTWVLLLVTFVPLVLEEVLQRKQRQATLPFTE